MGLFNKSAGDFEEIPEGFIVKSEQYLDNDTYYLAVLVHKETGVNYLFTGGESCTIAPMIGADGKVVVEKTGEKIY